jgi:RimJ/RimL family protein N-acetyltransferase
MTRDSRGGLLADSVALRVADPADIPFVMATERGPGFEWVVGRWDEDRHLQTLAEPGSAYLIGERQAEPFGFAILLGLDDAFGNILLKRIAVREPGSGFGRLFLRAVLGTVFERPQGHRIWLTVAPHNPRARHVYESLGFQVEGVMRQSHVDPAGKRFSPVVMSLLRPEWEALRST